MVSSPLDPAKRSAEEVFQGLDNKFIFHYDAETGDYLTPNEGFKVKECRGAWIKLDEAEVPRVLSVKGVYSGNVEIKLEEPGWHQIGPPLDYGWSDVGVKQGQDGETLTVARQAAGPASPHWMSRFLWGYDPGVGGYRTYDAQKSSFNLKKGQAYWVKTYEPGVRLVIPYAAPPPVPSAVSHRPKGISMGSDRARQLDLPEPPAPPTGPADKKLSVSVAPNPLTDSGKVTFMAASKSIRTFRVKVYRPTGELLFSSGKNEDRSCIWRPKEELSNGLYLFRVKVKNMSGRMVKKTGKLLVVN